MLNTKLRTAAKSELVKDIFSTHEQHEFLERPWQILGTTKT